MSAAAGASFVAASGIEPTLQLTVRDRNRLGVTAELLGGWALGAGNVLCLSGESIPSIGDHPDAKVVNDLSVLDAVGLVRRLREEGVTMSGAEVDDPPRYLIGVADLPLAEPYDVGRLEQKLDAGADVIWTQIALTTWRRSPPGPRSCTPAVCSSARRVDRHGPVAEREGRPVHERQAARRPRAARHAASARGRRRRRGAGRPRPHDRGRARHPRDRRRERCAPHGDGPRRHGARGRGGRRALPAPHGCVMR